eukprot:TRINITY_DN17057_c0_g1_i1.p1 TRINITY_DN17057_c0_g1~~TRINITY_DN17057_c0_g1_i1.p1  ORF type:complete len:944 (-),score=120.94 TRINITY_DN17057_c0_g1_i1:207-3038(-)
MIKIKAPLAASARRFVVFVLLLCSATCALLVKQQQKQQELGPVATNTSLFVAVFSFWENVERRNVWRQAWGQKGLSSPSTLVKFVLCAPASQDAQGDSLRANLTSEAAANGDMVFVGCEEGTKRTLLTRKLLLSMRSYVLKYGSYAVFMKTEDDSFVPFGRLHAFLAEQPSLQLSFIGMSMEAGRPVNRDPNSPWYQPEDSYPDKTYPQYMQRQGYLLGGALVRRILDAEIGEKNVLSNEDQAAGVWVSLAAQKGANVTYAELPGRDGEDPYDSAMLGQWKMYPYLVHHGVSANVASCLARLDAGQKWSANVGECLSEPVFVAIFSARNNSERRKHSREMLKTTQSGQVVPKFVLCSANDAFSAGIQSEIAAENDIMLLECEEGYSRTLLTKKLVASLKAFLVDYSKLSFFMKTDDDTFISWSRLLQALKSERDSKNLYLGIRSPSGMPVNRDPLSLWYQPPDTYSRDTYPEYMEGGTGYVISRQLVQKIISSSIVESSILSNEDQALGVWIDKLKRHEDVQVNFKDVPGTDGYRPEHDVCYGKWKNYPYTLHHKLHGEAIACLANLESANEPEASIDSCFADCVDVTNKFVATSLGNLEAKVQEVGTQVEWLKSVVNRNVKSARWLHERNRHIDVPVSSIEKGKQAQTEIDLLIAELAETKEWISNVVAGNDEASGSGPPPTPSLLQIGDARLREKPERHHHVHSTKDGMVVTPITFLHIPKNAGTAIEEAGAKAKVWWPRKWLSMWHGIDMPDGSQCEKYHVPPHHLEFVGDTDYQVYEGNGTFCVTRDPYDRVVSEYLYMLSVAWGEGMSNQYGTELTAFPKCSASGLNHFLQTALMKVSAGKRYIHDCHFVPQVEFIWGPDGFRWCKHVLRTDSLPDSFNNLMASTGSPVRLDLGKINNSTRACNNVSTEDLFPETKRLIDEVYHDDFIQLGYSKRSLI